MFSDAAAHSNHAYFTSGEVIREFDAASKNWTNMIKCPHVFFSMATMENELLAVGGLVVTGEPRDLKTFPATNKILSISLENNIEQNQWEEKYPAMIKERVLPKVVVFGKYLIVLGGNQYNHDGPPITSVEVLDTEKHCWYSNDEIKMPEEFRTMQWLTACVCDKYLYIAARHDDPNFDSTISKFMDMVDPMEADYDPEYEHNDDYDPDQAGPCYSFYRCSVEKLLQAAQQDNGDNSLARNQLVWQKLDHPHPSCYENKKKIPIDEVENTWETNPLYYNVCKFTLSCVDDTLVAVGCRHIESVSEEDVQRSLMYAYDSYRGIQSCKFDDNFEAMTSNDAETIDTKCHIYMFNTENFTWKLLKSTESENGRSCDQPSVAVAGNDKLVIIRKSKTVQIITFP